MNNKLIPQAVGVIFLLITTSVHSKERASDQQKNHSKSIENLINLGKESIPLRARVTIYHASETKSDSDTMSGKTASLVKIKTVQDMGLEVLAVNPAIMPYGTVGEFTDKNGNKRIGVAVDTGKDVKSAKASGGKTPVIDIYSQKAMTGEYHNFRIIKYTGPNFKTGLTNAQKLQYLQQVKDTFITVNRELAAR
ncbi:hypothetical protein H7Y21_00680 [Arenimonas sp.]|nr:hypothetical protein [Candidatus Parcubacteria bacterium]